MSSISRDTIKADCKDILDERLAVDDSSSRNEDFEVLVFEVLGRESYVSFLDVQQLHFCQVL